MRKQVCTLMTTCKLCAESDNAERVLLSAPSDGLETLLPTMQES